ncbi:MAG: hypothetical protein WA977_13610 [Halobacteriota archaeon]
MRSCGAWSGWLGLGFKRQACLAPRSPPRKFLGDCILQGAIDFAELRMRSGRVGGVAAFAHKPNFQQTFGF